jgi:RHS repeat-associated protein
LTHTKTISPIFPSVDAAAFGSFARYGRDNITFDRPGYLYIYLANETAADQEVYFDDLNIVHESAEAGFKVTQVNEYYPFGMATANSWTDPSYLHPGHLYQGLYAQYDSLTGTHTFQLRNYDPGLGRWWQTDPYMQFANPYLGMGNMPNATVDPDGGIAWWVVPAITAYIAGSMSALERGQAGWANPFKWNGRDRVYAAAAFMVASCFTITPRGATAPNTSQGQNFGNVGGNQLGFGPPLASLGGGGDGLFWDALGDGLTGMLNSPWIQRMAMNEIMKKGRQVIERVDLGQNDRNDLYKKIASSTYKAYKQKKSLGSIFDYSSAEKNFKKNSLTNSWTTTFELSEDSRVRVTIVEPKGQTDFTIIKRTHRNLKNTQTEKGDFSSKNPFSSYPHSSDNLDNFPFTFQYEGDQSNTLVRFRFSNEEDFLNFLRTYNYKFP